MDARRDRADGPEDTLSYIVSCRGLLHRTRKDSPALPRFRPEQAAGVANRGIVGPRRCGTAGFLDRRAWELGRETVTHHRPVGDVLENLAVRLGALVHRAIIRAGQC